MIVRIAVAAIVSVGRLFSGLSLDQPTPARPDSDSFFVAGSLHSVSCPHY